MDNIKVLKGNLFNSSSQTLVNTVNTKGVMGKGLALEFRLRYPEMFYEYKKLCKNNNLKIGDLWLFKTTDRWILNFPTKQDWKEKSKIEYLEIGLQKFLNIYKDYGITSIAFPVLGSNLGGLDQEESLAIMQKYLAQCEIPIEIYLHDSNLSDQLFEKFKNRLNCLDNIEFEILFNLSKKQIAILRDLLLKKEIKSVSKFLEVCELKGDTLEKIFDFALFRFDNSLIQKIDLNLLDLYFPNNEMEHKLEIINFYFSKYLNKIPNINKFLSYFFKSLND
ncbi:MAG: macro domain-containing protein [Ignavibacterium sp.]|nr:macro domain-containing protein [Ignavibacterium sp.]